MNHDASRRLAVLAGLLSLALAAGCSSDSGSGTACSSLKKGCVDLLNFSSLAISVAANQGSQVAVSAATNTGSSLAPGKASAEVPSTVGSGNVFDAYEGSTKITSVTCVVSATAWTSVNPAVVFQQTGQLTCSDW